MFCAVGNLLPIYFSQQLLLLLPVAVDVPLALAYTLVLFMGLKLSALLCCCRAGASAR